MRLLLACAVSAMALGLAAPASAAPWQSINQRQANLDARIDAGVRNGSLTRNEAYQLRTEYGQIAALERRYRANGLNEWERRDLDRRFDGLSQRIAYQRHDAQERRGGPSAWTNINARQRELDRRIDVGVRNGDLTRPEAVSLRREFNDIARQEAQFRRTGGGLDIRERQILDDRFDRLAQRIRWERRDWATRF
ncbi:MAG: hypothetical protein JNJ73_02915 [Hyphomonadaceae bacterium]|nr:hypothetical protein [Hyphomonadaceae bacterium]